MNWGAGSLYSSEFRRDWCRYAFRHFFPADGQMNKINAVFIWCFVVLID
jgi:hypothetical protein